MQYSISVCTIVSLWHMQHSIRRATMQMHAYMHLVLHIRIHAVLIRTKKNHMMAGTGIPTVPAHLAACSVIADTRYPVTKRAFSPSGEEREGKNIMDD